MNIINKIKEDVEHRCSLPSNFFGKGCFDHIKSVAYHSVELAKLYGADEEVCELAGWLHDIASVTDYDLYDEHHIHGTVIAEELLTALSYPKEKIDKVKLCILNHRGSTNNERLSIEEICVADADAISHYDNIPSLLYLAFVQRKLDLDEGKKFVLDKLTRSYKKMSIRSQEFYKEKKNIAESLL